MIRTRSFSDSGIGALPRRGFTLIELLTVIAILGLLISIIVPSFVAARKYAKASQCKTLIFTLGTGVNMFRSDDLVGGDYPPSYNKDRSPYANLCGAQMLTLAVVGRGLTGTAGFDENDDYDDGPDGNGNLRGPFVDVSNLIVDNPVEPDNKIPWTYPDLIMSGTVDNRFLVILDAFNMPILYYKATNANEFDPVDNMLFAAAAIPQPSGAKYNLALEGYYNNDPKGPSGLRGYTENRRLATGFKFQQKSGLFL